MTEKEALRVLVREEKRFAEKIVLFSSMEIS